MKNISKLTVELVVTIVVAGLLCSVVGFMLAFIVGNIGIYYQQINLVNTIIGIVFGFTVGYKVNTLFRQHKA